MIKGNKNHPSYVPVEKRFFEGFKKMRNGCWEWQKGTDSSGYGTIGVFHKLYSTHRVSWELHKGKIPKGLHVLHKCDNPPCVNPKHLWLGTRKDNMQDAEKKGRLYRVNNQGEKHGLSKLTEKQVLEIRRIYTGKWGEQPRLAREYNVSSPTINNIINKKTWKHI